MVNWDKKTQVIIFEKSVANGGRFYLSPRNKLVLSVESLCLSQLLTGDPCQLPNQRGHCRLVVLKSWSQNTHGPIFFIFMNISNWLSGAREGHSFVWSFSFRKSRCHFPAEIISEPSSAEKFVYKWGKGHQLWTTPWLTYLYRVPSGKLCNSRLVQERNNKTEETVLGCEWNLEKTWLSFSSL